MKSLYGFYILVYKILIYKTKESYEFISFYSFIEGKKVVCNSL